jgi:hypothetical protein
MPPERVVRTAAEAVEAAAAIGFPVVLKGLCAAITHKSDAGLVLLNLANAQEVEQGVAALERRAHDRAVALDGILVAQMARGGIETVLGVGRDAEMGPFVMFGLGGVAVELFKDVAFAPISLTADQADALIGSTRVDILLRGFRGAPPADRATLKQCLLNMARLAADLGDVLEAVEINPLLAREGDALALDALVVLRPPQATERD